MKRRDSLNDANIVLDLTYKRVISDEERQDFEARLVDVLHSVGLKEIAASRRGISVSGPRSVLETLFQTNIELIEEKRPGGDARTAEHSYGLRFGIPPTIPAELAPFVGDVKLPPTIIPL